MSDSSVGALATGYSIIKAGSYDEAVEMPKGCPILLAGGKITVYGTFLVE